MKIEKNKVVSIDYTLKNAAGEIIDESNGAGPLNYIHGNDMLITGLEKLLEGKKAGDSFHAEIEPAEGYGERQEDLIMEVPREHFPEDIEIEEGMQFEATDTAGTNIVTIKSVQDKTVTIDSNHPLAGQKLFFDITVVEVRDQTEAEIAAAKNSRRSCSSGGCGSCGSCGSGSCYH
jgi:FKBP-type peptidyl-prolyl cis-trans isomerase SlyD